MGSNIFPVKKNEKIRFLLPFLQNLLAEGEGKNCEDNAFLIVVLVIIVTTIMMILMLHLVEIKRLWQVL